MNVLVYFKFSTLSFLISFILLAYSLLGKPYYYSSIPSFNIRDVFFFLFAPAILAGLILDLIAFIFKRTWYQSYQYTIGLAIWSIMVTLVAVLFSGGGHGLGIIWSVIFRLPSYIAVKLYPSYNDAMFFIIWIILGGIQGAAVGYVIDLTRKTLKTI